MLRIKNYVGQKTERQNMKRKKKRKLHFAYEMAFDCLRTKKKWWMLPFMGLIYS